MLQRAHLTAFVSDANITNVAKSITVPHPTGINAAIPPDSIQVRAPSANGDIVYVETVGTATTASVPVRPGEIVEIGVGTAISVIAASGVQTVEITAYYP